MKIKKYMSAIFILATLLALFMAMPLTGQAAANECEINGTGYATFDDALADVQDGDTIKLLQDVDYNKAIVIDEISITFDLDSTYTLTVDTTLSTDGPSGLHVTNGGEIKLSGEITGTAEFIVLGGGIYAVYGGKAAVTNVIGILDIGAGGFGVYARGGSIVNVTYDAIGGLHGVDAADFGTNITVGGNAIGLRDGSSSRGVYAYYGATVTVGGNTIGGGYGVYASEGAIVTVLGNVESNSGEGVFAHGTNSISGMETTVTVGGNVIGYLNGVSSYESAIVRVTGDVGITTMGNEYYYGALANSGGIIEVGGNVTGRWAGVWAHNGATITVSGNVVGTSDNGYGAIAYLGGATIIVNGDIMATGDQSHGVYCGYYTANECTVIVNGTVITSGIYVIVSQTEIIAEEGVLDTTKPGYWKYSDNNSNPVGDNIVWVKTMPIDSASINITAPAIGNAPSTTAPTGGTGYTCSAVTWMPSHNPFQSCVQYTASVTLTAIDGYTFPASFTATVNGNSATVSGAPGNAVTVSYQFAAIPAPTPWENPFTDIDSDHWFYDDVEYAYTNGLMNGTSDTTFGPNISTTRGMIVTVLYRLAGEPDVSLIQNPFSDLTVGAYYYNAVRWAAENHIVLGRGDGTFGPSDDITRQDLCVIFERYAEYEGITLPEIVDSSLFADDNKIANYAYAAVYKMRDAGIVTGRPGNIFDPTGKAIRAEFAAMLHRFATIEE